MSKTIHGKIRGNTIELAEDLGLADGQEVEVQVTVVSTTGKGEGTSSTGSSTGEWTSEDDRILSQLYLERKRDTRREIPE